MKKLTLILILSFTILASKAQLKPITGTSLTINGTGICNAYIKDNLRANVLNLPSLSSYPTTPTPTRGDLINKGDTLKYYTGSMWINVGVFDTANIYKELNSKQDTGLSLLKSDTITKVVTISQLSDSLDSWNNSLAKQITADDTTWWGQSTDTTNISLRIDSCLKVADSTDYITTHAYQTDTAGASNTGTVPAYRYNYWNSKQAALTNPVTASATLTSNLVTVGGGSYTLSPNEGSIYATSTGLGIGVTPSYALHVEKSTDGAVSSAVFNTSTGSTARVNQIFGQSTAYYIGFQYYNTGYKPSGNSTPQTGYINCYGSGGIKIRSITTNAPIQLITGGQTSTNIALIVTGSQTFQSKLGNAWEYQSTIGTNTTNDKKISTSTNYRAIFQNYSGGAYGDSVSIANNGDIYTPGLIRIGSTNADSIAATRGYVKDAINDSLLNAGQIVTKNTGNTVAITGTSTSTYGIFGNSTSGFGIYGLSASNQGVRGTSSTGYGVAGTSSSNIGVYAHSTSGAGIYGSSASNYGGYFETATNLKIISFQKAGTNSGEKAYIDTNGYFSGGIKADANDTIFFGSDYLTGTGSGELRTESDISVGSAEVNGDLEAVGYYIGNNEVIKESEISNSLAINGHGDYDNVRIAADTLFLNHDLFTYGLSTTLTQHVAHLEAKDSTTTIANTGTYYILRKWRTDTAGTVTVTDSTIKIDVSGFYYVYLNSSFSGINNATIECDLFINDVINDGSFGFKRKLSTGGDVGAASFSGVRYFNVNDILKVRVKSDVTGTLTAGRKNFGCFRLN